MIRLRRLLAASAVPLAVLAGGPPIAAVLTSVVTPRVIGAQVPRLTPPPPCRASGADTTMLNVARFGARRGVTSVAVLAFDSRVLDDRRAHLGPALTARLRSRIARIGGVAVESQGTVERVYAASGGRIDSLLSILQNRLAVTGDVIPQRDRIDITVRIMESGKVGPRWERVFAYPRASIRDVEDAVTAAIVEISGGRVPRAAQPMSAEAYDAVLRGDYFLAQHDVASADSARRSYERAMQADRRSAIAPARAALARAAFLDRASRLDTRLIGEQVLAGMALVDASLRIDSTLAEAWTARAMLLRYRNPANFQGAVAAHERAVKLAPNSAHAHDAYGVTLMRLGRDAAAEQHLRRALALEQNRPTALRALAELEYLRRRYGSSCALANASIGADSYDPLAYAVRARVRMQLSEFRDAFSDAETADRLSSASWGGALQLLVTANASSVDDVRLEARRVVAERLRPGVKMSVAEGVYTSLALESLGDRDRALEALRRVEPTGAEFISALRDVGFDQMRRDARFRGIATVGPMTARGEVAATRGGS